MDTDLYWANACIPGSSVELTAFLEGENIEDLTQGSGIGVFFQVLSRIDSKANSQGRSISSVNTIILIGDSLESLKIASRQKQIILRFG